MAAVWPIPEHSHGTVDRAGDMLANAKAGRRERREAITVMNNWRAAHAFPLNTIQVNLREQSAQVSSDAVVAQRLKRLESIEGKLRRYPRMKLSRMNDIGGCRAVLPDVNGAKETADRLRKSRARHELAREDDYLANPKESGYRGIHLIYRYQKARERNYPYNGLRIEVQLRSQLQHAWATAVETVSIFSGQALKASEGQEEWLRMFALMSSDIADTEGLPHVPQTPRRASDRRRELRKSVINLDALQKLIGYQVATVSTAEHLHESHKNDYCVLKFNWEKQEINVSPHEPNKLSEAIQEYEQFEDQAAHGQPVHSVLVRGGALAALRRAYPNYFADTSVFVEELEKAIA